MTLPDTLHPVLVRALAIAIDERTRHLVALGRDEDVRAQLRALRDEIEQLREAQVTLLQLVLR